MPTGRVPTAAADTSGDHSSHRSVNRAALDGFGKYGIYFVIPFMILLAIYEFNKSANFSIFHCLLNLIINENVRWSGESAKKP